MNGSQNATTPLATTQAPAPRTDRQLLEEVLSRQPRADVRLSMETVDGFEALQRAGKLMAASSIVPKDYQGNVPNCVIALNIAARIKADPLLVMQNLILIHGRPSWSSQFAIASFNSCGRFSPIRYSFTGKKGSDTWGCIAQATDLASGEILEGSEITISMAKAEGWYGRAGSKWQTMAEQMLRYRSATFFVRAVAPELLVGLSTTDEVEDMGVRENSGAVAFPRRRATAPVEAVEAIPADPVRADAPEPIPAAEVAPVAPAPAPPVAQVPAIPPVPQEAQEPTSDDGEPMGLFPEDEDAEPNDAPNVFHVRSVIPAKTVKINGKSMMLYIIETNEGESFGTTELAVKLKADSALEKALPVKIEWQTNAKGGKEVTSFSIQAA